jgi:hypothetical protein
MVSTNANTGEGLTAAVERIDDSGEDKLVQITVLAEGSWIGDFFVTFGFDGSRYVADWSAVCGGNGEYVDEQPPFWPVEAVADQLTNSTSSEYVAINSGPDDL